MKILLGVGGSELSYHALDETIERADEAGDDLTIAIFDSEEVETTLEEIQERVEERLAATGFDADVRHIESDQPGGELVELAESEGFDRIVLGGGKRSPLGKIQLGSIVEFVLLNAQTPVTLIR
ncbi:universal stress protein [Halomicroarcula sp. GCM10025817]|uniref:universal stress protein n=1 Tax=Haloarcula TaxID=2237 RepID=UPI0023E75838|nr:universal stress protein [Halomicroarcula sp. SYNS111]